MRATGLCGDTVKVYPKIESNVTKGTLKRVIDKYRGQKLKPKLQFAPYGLSS